MAKVNVFLAISFAGFLLIAGCLGSTNTKTPKKESYQGRNVAFDLVLKPMTGNNRWELYPGVQVEAWGFAPDADSPPTIPGPEIRVREGDHVQITFRILAGTPMPHTIHWHGLHVPWDQDGVPYLTQAPLGDPQFGGNGIYSYTYSFTVRQSGTYWYHCHVDTQHHLDMGMYGAFIVEPADAAQDPAFDQEATLLLDEWDKSHIHSSPQPDNIPARSGDPEETVDNAYSQVRDYYHMGVLTQVEEVYNNVHDNPVLPEPVRDALPDHALRENRSWYPVTYPAYYADYDTFLLNGHAFPSTEAILVDSGKTLRLRLINAGSLVHAMHLHGHHFQVTHKDGYLLPNPYYADTILIAPGERYDLYVKLDNPGPWMFHDHMPQHEQNDHINPGGMMTHLCYRDGWALSGICQEAHAHEGVGYLRSGDIVEGMTRFLQATQNAYVSPDYAGMGG